METISIGSPDECARRHRGPVSSTTTPHPWDAVDAVRTAIRSPRPPPPVHRTRSPVRCVLGPLCSSETLSEEGRGRATTLVTAVRDHRGTTHGQPHPNMGCVLWTADASSNATTTSVCAGKSLRGAPRRNRTATPSLPWNHQEPLCEPAFPRSRPTVGAKAIGSLSGVMRSRTATLASGGAAGGRSVVVALADLASGSVGRRAVAPAWRLSAPYLAACPRRLGPAGRPAG
jgi:hypothetical protein